MEGKLRVNCHSVFYPFSVVLDMGWINFISHVLNISNTLLYHMQDTSNVNLFDVIYYFHITSVSNKDMFFYYLSLRI